MTNKSNSHQLAILALIVANIIWGASSPIFKWALQNVPLFTLAFLRFFFASLILSIFTIPQAVKIKRSDFFPFFTLGILMFLHISAYFLGLKYAPSINAPIIASAGPIFMILLSIRILHEHPRHKVISGTALSLIGVMVIIFRSIYEIKFAFGEVAGNMLYLSATLLSVFHAISAKKLLEKYPSMLLTWVYFMITSLLFAPFFIREVTEVGFLPNLDVRGIVGIMVGIFLTSTLAHSLYIFGISKIEANEIGIFSYIDPVAAIIIALPLLGEKITLSYLFGSTLVFLGIFIAEGRIHWHPLHRLKKN